MIIESSFILALSVTLNLLDVRYFSDPSDPSDPILFHNSFIPHLIVFCSKQLYSFPVEDKYFIWSVEVMQFFSGWVIFCYVFGCAFGLSMVRGYKEFTLWPMASPWNCLAGLYEITLVWTQFSGLFIYCSIFYLLILPVDFLFFNFWNMSCKLVIISALIRLASVQELVSVCWDWWLFVYLAGFAGFSLGSDRGFLLSLVCCWGGPWVVSLLNLKRLCDDKFAEVY